MIKIPFGRQAYQSRSLPISSQRCMNLYAEEQHPDAKDQLPLHGTPGTVLWATVGNGPIQAMEVMDGVLYVVSGGTLYSVNSAGTATSIGSCVSGSGRVQMATNGTHLVIVDGSKGYSYSVSGGLAQITDAGFYASDTVTFQDGYFILNRNGTGQFYISGAYAVTFDALDFATAEGDPDDLKAVISNSRELWLFGAETSEVWWNSGAAFPFERYQGTFIEKGCAAAHSPAKIDNTVFWLGDDRGVYAATGYQPQKISTPAIDYAFSNYTTVGDAFAYTYSQEGHKFYVLTFPTENATWVYDLQSKLWHERATGYPFGRHVSNCYAHAYSKHLVGDWANGKIYYFDLDVYTDNGTQIIRDVISPTVHDSSNPLFMSKMQVDVESGVGLVTGQGSSPQAMLRWSDDGGRTWSNEHWSSMGAIGEYFYRVIWRKLGMFRSRIFWLRISDPVKVTIISAYAKITSTGTD